MLDTLEIQHRQSHEKSHLAFHPGLNTIIGRGDSGKSAILRAILWAVNNTLGESQISNWVKKPLKSGKFSILKESSVTIRKGPNELTRFRSSEANGYRINGETLKAIGQGVPVQVSDFFGIEGVNISLQHPDPKAMETSSYFLLGMSDGQAATYLNRVVNLEEIDGYLTASASLLKDAKGQLKRLQEAQDGDEAKLSSYSWVEPMEGRLAALEAMQADRDAKALKADSLKRAILELALLGGKIVQLSKVADLSGKLEALRSLAGKQEAVYQKQCSILAIGAKYRQAEFAEREFGKVASLDTGGLRRSANALQAVTVKAASVKGILQRHREAVEAESLNAGVSVLSGKLEAVKGLAVVKDSLTTQVTGLRGLIARYRVAQRDAGKLETWEALENKATRLRKVAGKLEGKKGDLASLRIITLTFRKLEASISENEAAVSELEAQRPETCPTCGGAWKKGHGHEA